MFQLVFISNTRLNNFENFQQKLLQKLFVYPKKDIKKKKTFITKPYF